MPWHILLVSYAYTDTIVPHPAVRLHPLRRDERARERERERERERARDRATHAPSTTRPRDRAHRRLRSALRVHVSTLRFQPPSAALVAPYPASVPGYGVGAYSERVLGMA
eukprot:3358188-Rhodomonas_salina.3